MMKILKKILGWILLAPLILILLATAMLIGWSMISSISLAELCCIGFIVIIVGCAFLGSALIRQD